MALQVKRSTTGGISKKGFLSQRKCVLSEDDQIAELLRERAASYSAAENVDWESVKGANEH